MTGLAWSVLKYPFRPLTALGSGLWWAIPLVQFLFQTSSESVPGTGYLDGHEDIYWFFRVVWFLLALAFIAASPMFLASEMRRRGCLAVVAVSCACLASQVALELVGTETLALALVSNLLYLTCQTTLMYMWGVRFVLLDAADAGVTVLYTGGIALGVALLVSLLPAPVLIAAKICLLVASASLLLAENARMPKDVRETRGGVLEIGGGREAQEDSGRSVDGADIRGHSIAETSSGALGSGLVGFYVLRVLLACAMVAGFVCAQGFNHLNEQLPVFARLVLAGVLLALLVLCVVGGEDPVHLAPLVPVGGAACIVAVSGPAGPTVALVVSAGAIAWFSWIALSSAQLSDLRERGARHVVLHMSIEKSIVLVALNSAGICGHLLPGVPAGLSTDFSAWTAICCAFVAVVGATYVLIRIYVGHIEQEGEETGSDASAQDVYGRACALLAERFGLSPRECDVLELLGRGYTRTGIREKLCIADGTARTHINHIHEKMGFHRNDELIDILHAEMTTLARR